MKSALVADLAAGRPTTTLRFKFSLAPSLDGSTDLLFIDVSVPLTYPHVVLTYH